MWPFALLIFFSAFLLFQVQPLISKFILPWFGGSASVWLVAMLFFQVFLLLGYLYSFIINHFKFKTQKYIHLVLILLTFLTLPIIPSIALKPIDSTFPVIKIIILLALTVGLPYFVLSTTGPLLQAWYARKYPQKNPYILYVLSNAGSLLALITFPFIFEPLFDSVHQAWLWSGAFVVFGLGVGILVWSKFKSLPAAIVKSETVQKVGVRKTILWILFPALASAAFLAVTNHICLDIATIPFLWILPFCLYLITFIFTFADEIFYQKIIYFVLLICLLFISPFLVFNNEIGSFGLSFQLISYSLILFIACMVCHGELYRLRPASNLLTRYYLMIAIGGALGGLFVAVLAPLIFTAYWDLLVVLFITVLVVAGLYFNSVKEKSTAKERQFIYLASFLLIVFFSYYAYSIKLKSWVGTVAAERNFYGTLHVKESLANDEGAKRRFLLHGVTLHGEEVIKNDKTIPAISYYSEKTAVALLLQKIIKADSREIGVVGLGTGTLAYYGQKNDIFTFYEINQAVIDYAHKYFSYLKDSSAQIKTVLGDARLSLEKEPDVKFDLLVLDAFSSDAIPVHLLTEEAFELYSKKIKETGAIVVHISNRYLDLAPVIKAVADKHGFGFVLVDTPKNEANLSYRAVWLIVTKNEDILQSEELKPYITEKEIKKIKPWTDHFSNLFTILN
ncbi:MAG: Integral membrane protein-like protein [Parcubacteria group bacterium GW2011_GWC2_39_14]|nr:MAG: Integral membrane protein-like protein [Parcubacteria group bacterium GW2011_GWC2_39_14]KKR53950.1 MAG: Integral membrane protein-like protein [Parcubacteria group bacterium GW2011_GWA2_40_23]